MIRSFKRMMRPNNLNEYKLKSDEFSILYLNKSIFFHFHAVQKSEGLTGMICCKNDYNACSPADMCQDISFGTIVPVMVRFGTNETDLISLVSI